MMDEPQVWDQQDGESAAAFGVFCLYREMHPTLRSLAQVQPLDPSGRSLQMLQKWSTDNKWKPRAKAYDAQADKLRQAQSAEIRRAELDRILEWGQDAITKSLESIKNLDPDKIGPQYAPRLMDAAMKAIDKATGTGPSKAEPEDKSFEQVIKELNKEVAKA